jgi:hypothetical protein
MPKIAPHTASDRAAALVLIFAVPAAFALLCLGWHRIFLGSIPEGGQFIAWALAAFIALGAIAAARAVASERVRLRDIKSKSARDHTWLAYLALLLFVSATGSLSSFIYYGEGTTVLTENIESCEECLKSLESTAALAVRTNAFNDLRDNVHRIQSALELEIRNERNCGDGPAALGLIGQMQRYLPSYRRPSGRIANCEDVDRVIDQYRQQRDEQLPLSTAYRTDRVAEKNAVRDALPRVMERNRAALDSAAMLLATQSVHGLARARKILEEVVKDIGNFGLRINSLSPQAPWTCKVNLQDARGLGSFWQIFEIVRNRIHRLSTLVYIAVAFAIDYMMIMFFARVIRGATEGTRDEPDEPDAPTPPTRLWADS